jgi:hypothetical protein
MPVVEILAGVGLRARQSVDWEVGYLVLSMPVSLGGRSELSMGPSPDLRDILQFI